MLKHHEICEALIMHFNSSIQTIRLKPLELRRLRRWPSPKGGATAEATERKGRPLAAPEPEAAVLIESPFNDQLTHRFC